MHKYAQVSWIESPTFKQSHTDFRHTFEIQLSKRRVLLQRLGQSTGTLSTNLIPCKVDKYAHFSWIESPTFKQSHTHFRHTEEIQLSKRRILLQRLSQS